MRLSKSSPKETDQREYRIGRELSDTGLFLHVFLGCLLGDGQDGVTSFDALGA